MSKWLTFSEVLVPAGRKTKIFNVSNSVNGSFLGVVKWSGSFRKYIFAPQSNTIFDAGCLAGVTEFLNSLSKK